MDGNSIHNHSGTIGVNLGALPASSTQFLGTEKCRWIKNGENTYSVYCIGLVSGVPLVDPLLPTSEVGRFRCTGTAVLSNGGNTLTLTNVFSLFAPNDPTFVNPLLSATFLARTHSPSWHELGLKKTKNILFFVFTDHSSASAPAKSTVSVKIFTTHTSVPSTGLFVSSSIS